MSSTTNNWNAPTPNQTIQPTIYTAIAELSAKTALAGKIIEELEVKLGPALSTLAPKPSLQSPATNDVGYRPTSTLFTRIEDLTEQINTLNNRLGDLLSRLEF